MEDVLVKVLVSVLTFIITGLLGWVVKVVTSMRKELKEKDNADLKQIVADEVDQRIQPLRQDLEDFRQMLSDQIDKEEELESQLVASYKFRLMHLCKMYIAQKYITQDQYDQLTEMYKLYAYLGGNGQAKKYYDRAIALPIVTETEAHPSAEDNK